MLKGFKQRYAELRPGLEEIMAESAPIFCQAQSLAQPVVGDPWYEVMKQVAGVISVAATGEPIHATTLVHPRWINQACDVVPLVSIHPYGVNIVHTALTMGCHGLISYDSSTINGPGLILYYGLKPFSWSRYSSGIAVDSRNAEIEADDVELWSILDGRFS